jgi:hypothetical protein
MQTELKSLLAAVANGVREFSLFCGLLIRVYQARKHSRALVCQCVCVCVCVCVCARVRVRVRAQSAIDKFHVAVLWKLVTPLISIS